MKKILVTLIIAGLFGIFTTIVAAQKTPRVDRRQSNQKYRTRQGVGSGELTRREAKSIRRSTKRINRYEKRAKSDGTVTRRERTRLNRMENRNSRKIFRKKHNRRDRN
jgi:hypothetical protein